MSPLVPSYIEAQMAGRSPEPQTTDAPIYPFITISRQAGAGGYEVAKAILDRFRLEPEEPLFEGWRLFGAATSLEVLKCARLQVSPQAIRLEDYHSSWHDLVFQWLASSSPQDEILRRLTAEIRRQALEGRVVIVGRGAMCLTSRFPAGIHVRLVAPLDLRVQRMQKLLNLSADAARRAVAERDAVRARYVREQFDANIEDPSLYDVVWNTDRWSPAEIAGELVPMARARYLHHVAAA